MSGLNSSTLHKELITTNFKTSLSGVCFQFGIFMTLNYFYTELAGFPLFIIYDTKAAISFSIIAYSTEVLMISSGKVAVIRSPVCPSTTYMGH